MDPEVVAQFNCLQQTGNFCPSTSNGPTPMSSSSTSPAPMSSTSPAPMSNSTGQVGQQVAHDLVFAVADKQVEQGGSLGTFTPSLPEDLVMTLALL